MYFVSPSTTSNTEKRKKRTATQWMRLAASTMATMLGGQLVTFMAISWPNTLRDLAIAIISISMLGCGYLATTTDSRRDRGDFFVNLLSMLVGIFLGAKSHVSKLWEAGEFNSALFLIILGIVCIVGLAVLVRSGGGD